MLLNQKIMTRIKKFVATGFALLILTSCGSGGGVNSNQIALPIDNVLSFFCATEGVFTDDCVLFDPNNSYVYTQIDDVTKWTLEAAAPSAKARFYIWATALARAPTGENQFYTAKALHEVFTISGDVRVKAQALLAYRSVLDNYFGSVTYFKAPWLGPGITYAQPLADLVGDYMHNPSAVSLGLLYTDPTLALSAMSSWGYVYDPATGSMIKIF